MMNPEGERPEWGIPHEKVPVGFKELQIRVLG